MSRRTKLAAIAAASVAAVALTASPALAWSTDTFTATSSSLVVKVGTTTVATCTGSTLTGDLTAVGASDATFLVETATATGCGVTVTPGGFDWDGSFSSGDASMEFQMSALGCTYSGTLDGSVSGSGPATVTFTDQPVSGSGWFCVDDVTVSATYSFSQP